MGIQRGGEGSTAGLGVNARSCTDLKHLARQKEILGEGEISLKGRKRGEGAESPRGVIQQRASRYKKQ